MAHAGYRAQTEQAVLLATPAVAKTVFGIKGDSGHGIDLKGTIFSFDSVTASEKPVLVEACICTWATNPPGTGSTTVTIDQIYGRAIPETFSAGRLWISEPTVITPYKELYFDPYKGVYEYEAPLGESADSNAGEGFALRMTPLSGSGQYNVRASMRWERV